VTSWREASFGKVGTIKRQGDGHISEQSVVVSAENDFIQPAAGELGRL
jgi:hypothetical protein